MSLPEICEEEREESKRKSVKGEVSKYLEKGYGEDSWATVARSRLGDELREGIYRVKKENGKCRICEWEKKT